MNVRHAKWMLLTIVALVVVSVAWSVATYKPRAYQPGAESLGSDVQSVTDKPTVSMYQGDKEVTRITGTAKVETKKEQIFKDMNMSHELADGRTVTVKADEAAVNPMTKDFEMRGDVEVSMSDGTRLKGVRLTRKLDRLKDSDIYESEDPIEFAKPGVSGKAAHLRADLSIDEFRLSGGVSFIVERDGEEPIYIDGPTVVYSEPQRTGEFPDGALMAQGKSTVKADVLVATLRPKDEKGLRQVVTRGNVQINHLRRPTADDEAPSGGAGGSAMFSGLNQLYAAEVTFTYAPNGRELEKVVATRGGGLPAAFTVVPDDLLASTRTLTADVIELEYQQGKPRQVVGEGNVELSMSQAGAEPTRTIRAGQLVADVSGGDLDAATFSEGVAIDEPGRHGEADTAVYRAGADVVMLSGGPGGRPLVTEGDSILKGDTIESRRRDGVMTANGSVELTYVERPGVAPAGGLQGLLGRASDPVRVLAASMVNQQRSHETRFEGDVRLWKGDSVIEAPIVTVSQEGRQLVAEGGARAVWAASTAATPGTEASEPIRIESEKLVLDDGSHKLFCDAMGRGSVRLRQGKSLVTGRTALFTLDPETSQVTAALLDGGVTFNDGNRQGQGGEITFDIKHGRKVVLRGTDDEQARMEVVGHGTSRGEELIFYLDEELVTVAGGRTDTTIKLGSGLPDGKVP